MNHLPECPVIAGDGLCGICQEDRCICPELRACEKRVRARYSAYLNADDEGSYAAGFRDALDAAREAVAEIYRYSAYKAMDGEPGWVYQGDPLAAIDALRLKP